MNKYITLLVLMFIYACNIEEAPSTDQNDDGANTDASSAPGTLLKTYRKLNFGAPEFTINYEYNDEGNLFKSTQVDIFGATDIITYLYDATGTMVEFEQVTTDAFGDITEEVNTFNYVGDNVVSICQDIVHTDGDGNVILDRNEVDKIGFEPNAAGDVELFTHYYPLDADGNDCNDVSEITNTEMLEYDSNGNMVRYQNSQSFFGSLYLTYTYDDNNHPYSGIKPAVFRKILGFSSVNNISSAIEYDADTDEVTGTVNYSYEFNSSNFPTKVTKVYSSPGGGFTQTTEFEYDYY